MSINNALEWNNLYIVVFKPNDKVVNVVNFRNNHFRNTTNILYEQNQILFNI